MKILQYKNTLTALSILATMLAAAQPAAAGEWYLGGSVSQAYVDEKGLDDNDTGGKIFGGYRINKNFAIEGSYYDFGNLEEGANKLSIDGFGLGVVGSMPLSDSFSVFAKVGIHAWDADISGPIVSQFSDDSDSDVFFGGGLDYAINRRWTVRGEFERYVVDEFDYDVGSVGIIYNF